MKILWFTWKDLSHPEAGGAERVNEEIARRLTRDGHDVTFIVGGFKNGAAEQRRDGYRIIRVGSRYTVYWHAYLQYKKRFHGWADLVVDEMNTLPFFCKFYSKERNILFVHQLCREIWFYQMRFPLSLIGYLVEPLYLRLLSDRRVITVSESTRQDLMRYGFSDTNIQIISEGINLKPITDLSLTQKFDRPTLLSLGAIRPMKRTADQIRTFEIAKGEIPQLKLIVAGLATGHYGRKVLDMIERSPYAEDIEYVGRVDDDEKARLLAMSHLLLVTSVKEGWGLVVTEANSQGTPAAVYDVDGLRDSVRNGATGLVSSSCSPSALADVIIRCLADTERYEAIRRKAWIWSKEITFDRSHHEFCLGTSV